MEKVCETPQREFPKGHMSGGNPCPSNIQNHHDNSQTHWLVFRDDRQGEISVFDPLLGHFRTN